MIGNKPSAPWRLDSNQRSSGIAGAVQSRGVVLTSMPSIQISYFQRTIDQAQTESFNSLGTETLDGVSEALLPRYQEASKIYFVKKFNGNACYQWLVLSVKRTAPTTTACASFQIVLEAPSNSDALEYLYQTLSKGTRRTLQSVVRAGNLVEVDYGHELAVGRSDGELRSNKRYSDTIQNGEMHKRRLAIVVNISRRSTLQVVPITSVEPAARDKTAFEISKATLNQLTFYGRSGKRSWAIANMIETVSTRRVLPPVSHFNHRGHIRFGRDTNYSVALAAAEVRSLKEALLHSISVRDYFDNLNALSQVRARVQALEPLVDQLDQAVTREQELSREVEHLRLCKEVADMWATGMGLDLQSEVDQLKVLYAEQPSTPP